MNKHDYRIKCVDTRYGESQRWPILKTPMTMIDSTIAFAALAHAGQKRRYTNVPYIVHPIEVMTMVHRILPSREDMAVAAVLHDVLEDCPVDSATIERRFGAQVLHLVTGLTAAPSKENRAARKAAELSRLAACDADVQTIKCCDMASNAVGIIQHDPRFAKVFVPEMVDLIHALDKAHPDARQLAWEAIR